MLRAEVASGSELGKEIDSYISKGALVPLNIIVDTIISAIDSAPVDVFFNWIGIIPKERPKEGQNW